jgi:hypothetical protein
VAVLGVIATQTVTEQRIVTVLNRPLADGLGHVSFHRVKAILSPGADIIRRVEDDRR